MSKLTETAIKKAEPKERPYRMSDGLGLNLEVRPSGAKVFVLFLRVQRKQITMTLGDFPALRLSEARERAIEAKRIAREGKDPRADDPVYLAKNSARLAREQGTPNPQVTPVLEERRFDLLIDRFIRKRALEGVADTTLSKLKWNLGGTAKQEFHGRDVGSIKPPEILALIERIQGEEKLDKAKDIHRKLAQVFDYAIALGLVEWNPAKMVTRAVVKRKGGRHPGLTDPRDVGALIRAIRLYPDGSGQNTRAALLLSAHTFLRSNEIRGARWEEIDLENSLWTVPATRMKGHLGDHLVPLSRQAVGILSHLAAYSVEGEDLVFPMPSKPGRYMSEATLNSALRRLGYDTRKEHCHHGFRTTFSTNMNEQGWHRDWIEAQLSHVDRDSVRRAYNKALYLEGRTQMMQAYSDWLDSTTSIC